ncbi:hypothetical protein U9M48_026230 [Paspalum notatum var. saurae]|uniref:Uncharacterized protein n=1 Tax=Paspalum notatum var. saurae TaxID=547442 RepID=A0AAQ3WYK5_PASNO
MPALALSLLPPLATSPTATRGPAGQQLPSGGRSARRSSAGASSSLSLAAQQAARQQVHHLDLIVGQLPDAACL